MPGWKNTVNLTSILFKTMLIANEKRELSIIMLILRVYCSLHKSGIDDEIQ